MKMVEIITIIEKIKVQIGSAILQFSLYHIKAEAINTPSDWIRSPRTCIKAALKLIFSFEGLSLKLVSILRILSSIFSIEFLFSRSISS